MATLPRKTSVVSCPLYGQRRMYLPVEVNPDRLHVAVLERGQG
jgi:hypothetical protein